MAKLAISFLGVGTPLFGVNYLFRVFRTILDINHFGYDLAATRLCSVQNTAADAARYDLAF